MIVVYNNGGNGRCHIIALPKPAKHTMPIREASREAIIQVTGLAACPCYAEILVQNSYTVIGVN